MSKHPICVGVWATLRGRWWVVGGAVMMRGTVYELVCLHCQQWQNPMVGRTCAPDLSYLTAGRCLSLWLREGGEHGSGVWCRV